MTRENPECMAITTARIDAKTDAEPFTAHAHGISPISIFSKSLIPIGRGMPIKKPTGASKSTATTYLDQISVVLTKEKTRGEIGDKEPPIQ